jgi:hypothetical protein
MRSAKLPSDEARYVVQTAGKVSPIARRNDRHACRTNRYRGPQSFQQKRCYESSAMLIAEDKDQRLAYCEGYLRDSTVSASQGCRVDSIAKSDTEIPVVGKDLRNGTAW